MAKDSITPPVTIPDFELPDLTAMMNTPRPNYADLFSLQSTANNPVGYQNYVNGFYNMLVPAAKPPAGPPTSPLPVTMPTPPVPPTTNNPAGSWGGQWPYPAVDTGGVQTPAPPTTGIPPSALPGPDNSAITTPPAPSTPPSTTPPLSQRLRRRQQPPPTTPPTNQQLTEAQQNQLLKWYGPPVNLGDSSSIADWQAYQAQQDVLSQYKKGAASWDDVINAGQVNAPAKDPNLPGWHPDSAYYYVSG